MKKRTMLIIAILSLTIGGLKAQTDTAANRYFNLNDCINYAYEHQTSLLNADLDRKIAEAKVKETIGIGLPQISGSANLQDYIQTPKTVIGDFISPAVYGVLIDKGVKDGNGVTIQEPNSYGQFAATFLQKLIRNYHKEHLLGLKLKLM
jgi:outer membrane protein